ncbi:MAG: HEAT repeat domain-containing protein [Coleofasciculus sp. Co-bin14]|nr:HEAT repeat domain-containing protein [Coleofasciculus sp. Co-bin14]MBD0388534.1 HEAT repeat domain-containing protein [Nostoc sp. C3-bin3]
MKRRDFIKKIPAGFTSLLFISVLPLYDRTTEELIQLPLNLSNDVLKRDYLNYLEWTDPLALKLAFLEQESQVKHIVKLALQVDLKLGARLVGEVKPELQKQLVELVSELKTPLLLKTELLGNTRSFYALPKLLPQLENKNSSIRSSTAEALGRIGNETAIPHLLKVLSSDENINARAKAAEALGKIGNEAAIPGLLKVLSSENIDKNIDVVAKATEALGEIGGDAAMSGLKKAPINNFFAYFIIANTLSKWGVKVDSPCPPLEEHQIKIELTEAYDKQHIPSLLKNLESKNFSNRRMGARGLKCLYETLSEQNCPLNNEEDEEVVSGLLKVLEDESTEIQGFVVRTLDIIGSETAIPGLFKVLNNESFSAHKEAAEVLGKIGGPELLSELWQLELTTEKSSVGIAIEGIQKRCGFYNFKLHSNLQYT